MFSDRHEIIDFPPTIPIKVFIHKLGSVTKHWHNSLELLMVLRGTVSITIDENEFTMVDEDIILINSNSIHEIYSDGAILIALQIKLSMFDKFQTDLSSLIFDCNSTVDDNFERYNIIRFAIASLIHNNAYRSEGTDYMNYSMSYYLVSQLLDHFKLNISEALQKQQKYMNRLKEILTYINKHYAENFSLNTLAEHVDLSAPYLSHFFESHMGITFSKFYTKVKLEHALSDLVSTKDSIETIAVRNGFTESHSFVRAFKKEYNMLPSAYRKKQLDNSEKNKPAGDINYLLLEPSNYLKALTKYLDIGQQTSYSSSISLNKHLKVENISIQNKICPLRHTFKTFITVGRAKDLLRSDIQNMLIDIQTNIGYKYIKFHGILSDDMMVVSRDDHGVLHFHYTLIDQALDFLLSIGLRPLIQFSFMPAELAAYPNKTVGYNPFITSPPAKMEEWNYLIEDMTAHLTQRYGTEEVKSWLFTVWNEPSTGKKMFGFGDDALFFRFYQNTFESVKKVCTDLQFGTPSMFYIENLGSSDWIQRFIPWCIENKCRPDFLNIHYYSDIIPPYEDDFFLRLAGTSSFPKGSDDFGLFIGSIKKIFRSLHVEDLPVYLTEWNFTMSHRNLINDTSFKTCYIMKNLLKNYDRLDSFGYWSLTDLIEENALPDQLFHGGLGIYTMNGLRKGVFYAFYFANMLGDTLVNAGEDYFITRKGDHYQLITYHYIHYGDLFASGELFDITDTNRYTAFDMSKNLSVSLQLSDMENGNYMVKEYFVNRHHGNAYDLWLEMGALPLTSGDTDILSKLCVPGFHQGSLYAERHTLTYIAELEPLEIRFAEIWPA